MKNKTREITQILKGVRSSDGDGVQLTRIIGSSELNLLDPFLLFDVFGSDKPQDYIGGFPPHPHRGFETVTYMLSGKMRHEDSAGNSGIIEPGGVQWMTAGKGIIHSEMPEQQQGLLSGFQLWVNLPASQKMTEPKYQERTDEEVPVEQLGENSHIKVIAGVTQEGTQGVIDNTTILPIYWHVQLEENTVFEQSIPSLHSAFIYVIKGQLLVGENSKKLSTAELAVLSNAENLIIKATTESQFLVIAGKPLNEPVERAGPFVMNTKAELRQAFSDYETGRLTN
ncbi:MAG TPA: pirin family protein [Aeromonadales bacterium]|nr:pirin family protein [Aeromonadales bacterium]